MSGSLFDIFGDHITRQTTKNVARQPLCNNENIGKMVKSCPARPLETPRKLLKPEEKKSFLSNSGITMKNTPVRSAFTPRAVNVASFMYNDADAKVKGSNIDDFQFTKPSYKYDNYHKDVLDFLPIPELKVIDPPSPKTPPPSIKQHKMEWDSTFHDDDFFTDDFNESVEYDSDLNLPDIY